MTPPRDVALIDELRAKPAETAWFEFKANDADPEMIGKRCAALSNAARIDGQDIAYMVWGVEDGSHAVVGTTFNPDTQKVGNQALPLWLANSLQPSIAFSFRTVQHPQGRLVLLEIPAATGAPVAFNGVPYIRIGSTTPRLTDYPERYQQLIERLQPYRWEQGIARQYASADEVLTLLDYPQYFQLTKQPLPDNRTGIFDKLEADGPPRNQQPGGTAGAARTHDRPAPALAQRSAGLADAPHGHVRRARQRLDKVVQACEVFQLPAPLFRAEGHATQAVLYGPRSFADMTPDERVRACYFHAVLKFLSGDKMKNASLCARLGISPKNAAQASAVINKTLEAGLIRVADPDHPPGRLRAALGLNFLIGF